MLVERPGHAASSGTMPCGSCNEVDRRIAAPTSLDTTITLKGNLPGNPQRAALSIAYNHQMDPVSGPLHQLRVLELGSLIAGPFAGQLLGDYGAEVIKVEPPKGDPMRRWGVVHEGEGLWWTSIARNKKSVVLDLHSEAGAAAVRRLASTADIVIENFRPGQLEQWGLGYHDLVDDNPGLIMVHVSGYGRTGPRSSEAGFGSIGEAMGGIRHTTGSAGGPSS